MEVCVSELILFNDFDALPAQTRSAGMAGCRVCSTKLTPLFDLTSLQNSMPSGMALSLPRPCGPHRITTRLHCQTCTSSPTFVAQSTILLYAGSSGRVSSDSGLMNSLRGPPAPQTLPRPAARTFSNTLSMYHKSPTMRLCAHISGPRPSTHSTVRLSGRQRSIRTTTSPSSLTPRSMQVGSRMRCSWNGYWPWPGSGRPPCSTPSSVTPRRAGTRC